MAGRNQESTIERVSQPARFHRVIFATKSDHNINYRSDIVRSWGQTPYCIFSYAKCRKEWKLVRVNFRASPRRTCCSPEWRLLVFLIQHHRDAALTSDNADFGLIPSIQCHKTISTSYHTTPTVTIFRRSARQICAVHGLDTPNEPVCSHGTPFEFTTLHHRVKPRSRRSGEGLRDLIKLVEIHNPVPQFFPQPLLHVDITQPILRQPLTDDSSDRCLDLFANLSSASTFGSFRSLNHYDQTTGPYPYLFIFWTIPVAVLIHISVVLRNSE
jgi:hypothetical protein